MEDTCNQELHEDRYVLQGKDRKRGGVIVLELE